MSNITLFVSAKKGIKESNASFTTFSDGSETAKLEAEIFEELGINTVGISVVVKDVTRDIMRIALVKEAIDSIGLDPEVKIHLNISYMPQARADRRFEEGMSHPLKVVAKMINAMDFHNVYIEDPHSDVTEALVDRCQIIHQSRIVRCRWHDVETFMPNAVLCAPDLGATKKIFDVAKELGHDTWVQALKLRDVRTGDIVKCDLMQDDVPEEVLIVDDISDGGASFKFLARKLRERGAKKVGLLVTHGIFKDGLAPLAEDLDYIWAHNIIGDYINALDIQNFNTRKDA